MKKRSGEAVAAQHRTEAGSMKHRLEPRGGAKNEQAELLEEVVEDPSRAHCRNDFLDGSRECYYPNLDGTWRPGKYFSAEERAAASERLLAALAQRWPTSLVGVFDSDAHVDEVLAALVNAVLGTP